MLPCVYVARMISDEMPVVGDAADRRVRRPRDPRAHQAEKQRSLTVGGAALALLDPLLEDRADERVQRDLAIRIAFARGRRLT
jgi:hypothetical protein